MNYFEHEGPIVPVNQTKVFDMVIAAASNLIACDVYFATMENGNTFTRVIMHPGTTSEQVIDLDKQEGEWICIYEMEPTVWTNLVAASLDYHISQGNKENKQ